MTAPNWDRIFEIVQAGSAPEWDQEAVGFAVVAAFERWVEGDLKEYEVVEVERYIEGSLRGKLDLVLRSRKDGRIKIVDYKSTKGKLDDRWVRRQKRSWQLKIYAGLLEIAIGGPTEFPVMAEIRGIKLGDEKPLMREIRFPVGLQDVTNAINHARAVYQMRSTYKDRDRWLQDPSGCRCFGDGYPCDFEKYCWDGIQAPTGGDVEKPLSHSSITEFLRCPERYRLLQVTEKDEREEAAAGLLFHAAIAEVYRGFQNPQNC